MGTYSSPGPNLLSSFHCSEELPHLSNTQPLSSLTSFSLVTCTPTPCHPPTLMGSSQSLSSPRLALPLHFIIQTTQPPMPLSLLVIPCLVPRPITTAFSAKISISPTAWSSSLTNLAKCHCPTSDLYPVLLRNTGEIPQHGRQ